MDFLSVLSLGQSALELGLIGSLTVLALFLSYSMLGVCDLSTDGCFTLGASVGAAVALAGHPWLAIPAAMLSGVASGFITAILQTKLGVDSLLAGIVVNTALYSVNIAVMGGASLLNLNKADTVFSMFKALLAGTFLENYYKLILAAAFAAAVAVLLVLFLRTRLGLAIRATGSNKAMVSSSSVSPGKMTIIGLCVSGSITALAGCLLGEMQKSVNVDIGSGMVTVALASLLIGSSFTSKHRIAARALGAIIGSVIFRLVYTAALSFNMPAFLLKFVSAVIVVAAISGPYIKKHYPEFRRRMSQKRKAGERNA